MTITMNFRALQRTLTDWIEKIGILFGLSLRSAALPRKAEASARVNPNVNFRAPATEAANIKIQDLTTAAPQRARILSFSHRPIRPNDPARNLRFTRNAPLAGRKPQRLSSMAAAWEGPTTPRPAA